MSVNPPTANNDLRCVAAEIIVKLFDAKDASQLELLKGQIDASLRELRPATERELLQQQFAACQRLKSDHKWKEAIYAPADRSPLLLIEIGSTEIHRGHRDDTGFCIYDGDDLDFEVYYSHPVLFKKDESK